MQAHAARRAFTSLASKIHPQLPLTPRESQQLLNLLTTSFRSHLDREHPTAPSEPALPSTSTEIAKIEHGRRAPSSYDSASEHIGSILSNPLFARRPQRRGSDSAAADVLKDPFAWFLDQVALGTADVAKASLCMDMLSRTQPKSARRNSSSDRTQRPASTVADWLRNSGEETSKDFMVISTTPNGGARPSLALKLVPMLLAEGNQAPLWRWFSYKSDQLGNLTTGQFAEFRVHLLKQMIVAARNRDEAFSMFLCAYRIIKANSASTSGLGLKSLQVVGGRLVNQIVASPEVPCTPELYEEFALSTQDWLRSWKPAVQAMLCLYHPTQPDPQPGLRLIKDPNGIIRHALPNKSRQRFLVRLCLGVAQQLIKEEKFADAQVAMEFTKNHFPELVLIKYYRCTDQKTLGEYRIQEEKKNMDILDRLLVT